MAIAKVLYRATAATLGGRCSHARSSDGALDVRLALPRELGGDGSFGTNAQQLFAAGYSACFLGTLSQIAQQQRVRLPTSTAISTTIGVGPVGGGLGLEADLRITLPGLTREQAQDLVEAAHEVCPFSCATRNNIEVRLHILT